MSSQQAVHADAESSRQEIAGNDLVMVDFWATWCAPCRAMTPLLDRLAGEFPHLKIVKIDADANADVLAAYDVKSVPTLLFYRSGNLVDRLVGRAPYAMMLRAVQSAGAA